MNYKRVSVRNLPGLRDVPPPSDRHRFLLGISGSFLTSNSPGPVQAANSVSTYSKPIGKLSKSPIRWDGGYDWSSVRDKISPGLVHLYSENTGYSGSGFMITRDLCLTSAHMLQGSSQPTLRAILKPTVGQSEINASIKDVVQYNLKQDWALLWLGGIPDNLPFISLSKDSDITKDVGDSLLSHWPANTKIFSTATSIFTEVGSPLQYSSMADTTSGSSGGPYANDRAKVIAMHISRSKGRFGELGQERYALYISDIVSSHPESIIARIVRNEWNPNHPSTIQIYTEATPFVFPEIPENNCYIPELRFPGFGEDYETGHREAPRMAPLDPFIFKGKALPATRHHIIPQTYMQFLYDKLYTDGRYRQTLLDACNVSEPLERDQFIYAPFNLFIGPTKEHRLHDPGEGIETYPPQRFPEKNWKILQAIGAILQKWSAITLYNVANETEFKKIEAKILAKCATLLREIKNQNRDIIHLTTEEDWGIKQGKLYLK